MDPEPVVLYSQSPAMREVTSFVERAAALRAGVLIRGEAGTGRRAVAQAIHERRVPLPGPFVSVDCALDAAELESKLFGVARASNGGDPADRLEHVVRGSLIDRANGGTLYLANLAEAPARVQARLARVLRDGEAFIDASADSAPLDVRPMSGVDPEIEECVHDGRVREDLFRRLAALQIDVPPLRERRADIPALTRHFIHDLCAQMHVPAKGLSPAAQLLIAALPWRGNAAELRTLVERVLGACNGHRNIDIEDVLAQLRLDGGAVAPPTGTLRQARARFEREYIAAVLEQHRGRISDAAKTLGIQRTNLYRKMRTLHVRRIKNDTSPIGS